MSELTRLLVEKASELTRLLVDKLSELTRLLVDKVSELMSPQCCCTVSELTTVFLDK